MRQVAVAAHRTCAGLGFVLALALHACHGPDVISLGMSMSDATTEMPPGPAPQLAFLSPTMGDDSNDGSREHPWKTFHKALPLLRPGSTLTLLEGMYDGGSTGYLNVTCDPGVTGAPVSGASREMPIAVRAEPERKAFLSGDASGPPLSIQGCSFWTFIGLRVESGDFEDAPDTADAGSVVVVGPDSHNLTFSRMLASHPNLYRRSHVFRIGDGSSDITVEDSELYNFHVDGFAAARTTTLKLLRNYINSRGSASADLPGLSISADVTQGDHGIVLEETAGALVANNVIETVDVGLAVLGRDPMTPTDAPPVVITGNQLIGNIVLGAGGTGLRIDSRCNSDVPCTNVSTKITNTTVSNDVFLKVAAGISSAGALSTNVQEVSVIGGGSGLRFAKEGPNAGIQSTSMTFNTFATVQAVAFFVKDETSWVFDDCEALSSNGADHDYQPDGSTSNPHSVDPMLGGCLVYLPVTSPLRGLGAGGKDVGANVLNQIDDDGQPTTIRLWDASTGTFLSCGDTVAEVNGDPATSCLGVGGRLHVGTPDCPLP